jgi:hypothetical protein
MSLRNACSVLKKATDIQNHDNDDDLIAKFALLFGDGGELATFDPISHLYMFDIGFPPHLFERIANIFNASVYTGYLISYKLSPALINTYGFSVELVKKVESLAMRRNVYY